MLRRTRRRTDRCFRCRPKLGSIRRTTFTTRSTTATAGATTAVTSTPRNVRGVRASTERITVASRSGASTNGGAGAQEAASLTVEV